MMDHIWLNRCKFLIFLLASSIFLSNCAFYTLKNEVAEIEKVSVLSGKVINNLSHRGPVIVILYSENGDKNEIVEYALPEDTGDFSFLVTEGAYYLAAFEDINTNFKYDEKEFWGYFGKPDQIIVPVNESASSESKERPNLEIQLLKTDGANSSFPMALETKALSGRNFRKIGQLTDLDDKIFRQENGSTGYWKPLTFLRDFGHGVYFIEPYDEDKIPIIFVHGASGTPVIWKKLVEQIDRQQYQPWFYYYPSGIQLDLIARGLNNVVKRLHDTYRFNELYITAHSMGGLVSRAFLMKNVFEDGQDYIKLFVSISTPWNGHRAASSGVERAPAVIPSWYDMVPDSDFIQSIYEREFPPDIRFCLFFSFRGGCRMNMGNNDGSVELASVLDSRAQTDADTIIGFDENHVSILSSQEVIGHYNEVLTSFTRVRGMDTRDYGITGR
jgi:hypothetical protein